MKFVSILLVLICTAVSMSAQRGDYMTASEQEVVRNNQDIDARIAVLTYMIDRRFIAMGIETKASRPSPGPNTK